MRVRDSFAAWAGIGGVFEQLECVVAGQVVEGVQGGGEEVAQRGTQPHQVPLAFPDQGLMGTSDELDRLDLRAVAGDDPQLVGVGAHHVGQHVGVTGVALGPGHGVPLPVASDLAGLTPNTV
jgi:hypothetical protein